MSSRDSASRLRDILDNADRIESYLVGIDRAAFGDDLKRLDAVERCLQPITEAVVMIGAERLAQIAPDIPVERVRVLGNMPRRAYDVIDTTTLPGLIETEIPALQTSALRALEI